MQIELTRSWMRAILDALSEGRCLCNPSEGGKPWSDSEMLAVAGACLSELMRRREELQAATTDNPLRVDMEWPYASLTARMTRALDFAIEIAGVARDRYRFPSDDKDKAYRMEIVYTRPGFDIVPVKEGCDLAASPDSNGAASNDDAAAKAAPVSVAPADLPANAEAPAPAQRCTCGCHGTAAA